ncbi:kinase-like protein [Dendrothele bispora CBS 962.96]|uniref:Kinase-like protein n=1 Tax=Dendrothele bispora (strain CBS 962.96) TaxID=1314807 RepID=A0A4S8LQ89_DENBC|nr:kinase-like protein [Dendrothele bispora CBS 962.96]
MSPAPLPDFNGVILEEAQLVIGECIGSGAFGRVHQATFVGHHYYSPYPRDARLAVKCLPRPSAPTPGPQRDSLQARELSSHLKVSSHPSIATIHQVLFDKTYFYVVMDRYDGDLFEAIVDKGVFKDNDELIKNVFLQILEAVEFCHSNGVYHRDLKPRNVLYEQVGEQMNVRLTDFGLATLNEVSNTIKCGTSRYMSPESFGTEYRREAGYSTVQSDIWSLGVVLFNMITGHNPWNSPSLKDGHFSSYVADNNHLFRKHNISPEVNNIIQRIFVVEPNSRISISKLKNEIKSVKTFFREMQDTVNTVPFPVNDSAGPQIPSPH